MSFSHTVTRSYRDSSGAVILSTEVVSGNDEQNYSGPVSNNLDQFEANWGLVRSTVQSMCLKSDQAIAIIMRDASFVPIGTSKSIAGTSDASPDVLNIVGHGLSEDDVLVISGVTGDTNINGVFKVHTIADADHIQLKDYKTGAAINGNGTFGGSPVCHVVVPVVLVAGQNRIWTKVQDGLGGLTAFPFSADFAEVSIFNKSGATANVEFRTLNNV